MRRYVSLAVTTDSDVEWSVVSQILLETTKNLIDHGVMKYEIASNALEVFPPTKEEKTTVTEHTMFRVKTALREAGLEEPTITEALDILTGPYGIRFREVTPDD